MSNYLTSYYCCFCQQTPLHLAARDGRVNTVECLVRQGADIFITDNHGVQNVTTVDIWKFVNLIPVNYRITESMKAVATSLSEPL